MRTSMKILKAFMQSGLFTDLHIIGGLGMLFYGLHLYQPWVAFTVVGAVLAALGILLTFIR